MFLILLWGSFGDSTHKGGHTLDLVLQHGVSIIDLDICENGFSDHKTIMFTVPCHAKISTTLSCKAPYRCINNYTKSSFLTIFDEVMPPLDEFACEISTEALPSRFNSTCSDVLNAVAPLKSQRQKSHHEPWIDDSLRCLRRCCRRAK